MVNPSVHGSISNSYGHENSTSHPETLLFFPPGAVSGARSQDHRH